MRLVAEYIRDIREKLTTMSRPAPKLNVEEGSRDLFAERLTRLGLPQEQHGRVRLGLRVAAILLLVILGYQVIEVLADR